ncbi:MAG: hypothetical protein AAB336_11495 [Acidobacteriota bacterium]
MTKTISIFAILILSTFSAFAQKGVDTQTQKITEKTGNNETTNVSRSINWGKDKTKVREKLANPYKLASRRDVLIQNILIALEEKKLIVDEAASKPNEGIIITQPFIFAKGSVITKNELNRYAILPSSEAVWRSGRYSLRIDVESIDGIQNNVTVMAKVEGKSESGFISEWNSLPTSGAAEEEFLIKLVEMVTGKPVDEPIDKK